MAKTKTYYFYVHKSRKDEFEMDMMFEPFDELVKKWGDYMWEEKREMPKFFNGSVEEYELTREHWD